MDPSLPGAFWTMCTLFVALGHWLEDRSTIAFPFLLGRRLRLLLFFVRGIIGGLIGILLFLILWIERRVMVCHGVVLYPKSGILFYGNSFGFGWMVSLAFLFVSLFKFSAVFGIVCVLLVVLTPHTSR